MGSSLMDKTVLFYTIGGGRNRAKQERSNTAYF